MICEQCGGNRVFSYPPPANGCPGCGAPVCCQTCCDARHDGYNREDDLSESTSSPAIPKMQAFAPMEEMARLRAELLAPGVMRCAKCNFGLQRVSLNVNNGTATAGDSKTEACPNGCGPLWPVTWKELSSEHLEAAERFLNELEAARKDADKLRAELAELRAQVPMAYMHNKRADVIHTSVKSLLSDFSVNYGPESMLRPIDKSEHYTIPLYAAPVPAQPASIGMDIAAGIDGADYVSPRLRAELGMPTHIAELATNIRRNISKAQQHVFSNSDIEPDGEMLDLLNHMDTIAQQIETDAAQPAVPDDVAKDAARYRFIKERSAFGNRVPHIDQYPFQQFDKVKFPHFTIVGVDDAIDAAILSAADYEVKNGNG